MITKPDSDPPSILRRFLPQSTAAALLLLLTSGHGERVEKMAAESASARGVPLDEEDQKFWKVELDAAIDDCLEACDLSDMISLTTVCACLKKNEEVNLHAVVKNISPRMRAALQNLADVLHTRPHLAKQGCAVLRGKLDVKPSADYRRLITNILPPDDDPMFCEPWRMVAITGTFLDDEEYAKLLSQETRERIMMRRYRSTRHLVTRNGSIPLTTE